MRAVRFDEYGDLDKLDVREVEDPRAADGRAVVRVRATGINPGEAAIREGRMDDITPATFPSGQGADLAGVVEAVPGDGVPSFSVGDEVLGWSRCATATGRPTGSPAWSTARSMR